MILPVRFALAPAASRFESVGEHLVVFNEISWDTHLLNEAAAALLLSMVKGPRTLDELTALLEEVLVDAERSKAGLHAVEAIEQLRSLGLVEPDVTEP